VTWALVAVGLALALVALALVWVARAVEELVDILDARWEHVTDE
jgi:hypothetical protein